jgi:hypothetical protein
MHHYIPEVQHGDNFPFKSNLNWFTVDNGYSVLYLLLVHNRAKMLLTIIKYLDEYQIRGKGFLADNAGYYEAIERESNAKSKPFVTPFFICLVSTRTLRTSTLFISIAS